jgi:hypothetical protein
MKGTLVSVAALALAFGGPALAADTADRAAAMQNMQAGQAAQAQPGAGPAAEVRPLELDRIKDKLERAGFAERSEVDAKIVRARTAEGHSVFMLIGPEDMRDGSIELSADEVREKFEGAGFMNVHAIDNAHLVRAQLDDDKSVLVLATDRAFLGAGGEQVQPEGDIQIDRVSAKLEEAGIEDRDAFRGRVVRAETSDGHGVLMLVGRDGFREAVAFDRDDLRGKLSKAGFQNVRFVDEAHLVRGKLDDKSVFAMAGRDIFVEDIQSTGAIAPAAGATGATGATGAAPATPQ